MFCCSFRLKPKRAKTELFSRLLAFLNIIQFSDKYYTILLDSNKNLIGVARILNQHGQCVLMWKRWKSRILLKVETSTGFPLSLSYLSLPVSETEHRVYYWSLSGLTSTHCLWDCSGRLVASGTEKKKNQTYPCIFLMNLTFYPLYISYLTFAVRFSFSLCYLVKKCHPVSLRPIIWSPSLAFILILSDNWSLKVITAHFFYLE